MSERGNTRRTHRLPNHRTGGGVRTYLYKGQVYTFSRAATLWADDFAMWGGDRFTAEVMNKGREVKDVILHSDDTVEVVEL